MSQLGQLHFVRTSDNARARIDILKPTVSWSRVARLLQPQEAIGDNEVSVESATTREKDMDSYISMLVVGKKMRVREHLLAVFACNDALAGACGS